MEAVRVRRQGFTALEKATSEESLLQRAQGRDQPAFDALVQCHVAPLRQFLRRRLPPDAVEDVLQEALLGAWSALPNFTPRVRFKTWLYRIALNKAADWQRRAPQDLPLACAPLPAIHPLGQVEDSLLVQSLLAQLSEEQRLILELYYFDDLTLAEVAVVLDRNLNTIKYHFYQAHAHGLRLLQRNPEELA